MTEPGWYPDQSGQQRWWTGTEWGQYAPPPQQQPPNVIVNNHGCATGCGWIVLAFLAVFTIAAIATTIESCGKVGNKTTEEQTQPQTESAEERAKRKERLAKAEENTDEAVRQSENILACAESVGFPLSGEDFTEGPPPPPEFIACLRERDVPKSFGWYDKQPAP